LKGSVIVAKQKQSLWDEVANGVRQILEEMDRLLHPEKRRKTARVPVPVRVRPPYPNPYEDR
jgi:hypothetical protein